MVTAPVMKHSLLTAINQIFPITLYARFAENRELSPLWNFILPSNVFLSFNLNHYHILHRFHHYLPR